MLSFLITLVYVIVVLVNSFAVVEITTSPGWNIFNPNGAMPSYRYGPSIIINDDNSIDMWTSTEGGDGAWDYIRHRKSTDGGRTWGTETIALRPTQGSIDALSVCDPGVIKYGGYYYIAYTSTQDTTGLNNSVFVARSTSPTGPFSKWNGSGWGGNPQPFIVYNGDPSAYGAGEPSLVKVNDTLYIYYTWLDKDANGNEIRQERVNTANATNPNWPGSTTYQGVAVSGFSSFDVKYIPAYGKFVAATNYYAMWPQGIVILYESTNGINFTPANAPKMSLSPGIHNIGISGTAEGHINLNQNNFIAYANGSFDYSHASWATNINPITYTNDNLPAVPIIEYAIPVGANSVHVVFKSTPGMTYKVKYGTKSGTYTNVANNVTSSPHVISGLTPGTTYYFVVVGTNGYGDSANSIELKATPTGNAALPVASSDLGSGYEPAKAVDGNIATFWSSKANNTAASIEWIYMDAGSTRVITGISLTSWNSGMCFPVDFKFQYSNNGSQWTDIPGQTYTNYPNPGNVTKTFKFGSPVSARYIRLYATKLSYDGYYYFARVAEMSLKYDMQFFGARAVSSSNWPGWDAFKVLDRLPYTCWSSNIHSTANNTEWIYLETGEIISVNGVSITPRATGLSFPVDFKFQYRSATGTWVDIPGQSYTNYPNPGSTTKDFNFSSPVMTSAIRMIATKLSTDDGSNFFFQLGDMRLKTGLNEVFTSSSFNHETTGVYNLLDDNYNTIWSSTSRTSQNETEWICIDMGRVAIVNKIEAIARNMNYNFPINFKIEFSYDNVNWYTVPGHVYTDYLNVAFGDRPQMFQFLYPVSGRYFRMIATKLWKQDNNNHLFQLSGIRVEADIIN